MQTDSRKLEESNRKRLESLRQKTNEFKQKKESIRNDISRLDTDGVKNPKKIIFKSSSDEEEKSVPSSFKNKKLKKKTKEASNEAKKEKPSLIGNDSDDDDYDINKVLESKLNLNEKQASKLINLKSKYAQIDDGRFKIDDRFVASDADSSSDDEDSEIENPAANESEDDNHFDTSESVEKKYSEKKLKKEKDNAFKILESITGKPIINKLKTESESKMNRSSQIIRYNPLNEEHKKFEINDDDDSDDLEEVKVVKDGQEDKKDHVNEYEDKSKFVQVEPNLKELLNSSGEKSGSMFQFKFDAIDQSMNPDDDDDDDDNDEEYEAAQESKTLLRKVTKFNAFSENLNSSESETESVKGERSKKSYDSSDDERYNRRKDWVVRETDTSSNQTVVHHEPVNYNALFPFSLNSESTLSKDLTDALSYFSRKLSIDEIRSKWEKNRAEQLDECRKKDKKVKRKRKGNSDDKSQISRKLAMIQRS